MDFGDRYDPDELKPPHTLPAEVSLRGFLSGLIPPEGVEDPDLLILSYHMAEAFVVQLEERRKVENQRILDMVAAWKQKKKELAPRILNLLELHGSRIGGPDKRKLNTLLGVTYRITEKDFSLEIEDEEAAIEALLDSKVPGCVEEVVTRKLTKLGKQHLLDTALAKIAKGEALPTWLKIRRPGFRLATKLTGVGKHPLRTSLVRTWLEGPGAQQDEEPQEPQEPNDTENQP